MWNEELDETEKKRIRAVLKSNQPDFVRWSEKISRRVKSVNPSVDSEIHNSEIHNSERQDGERQTAKTIQSPKDLQSVNPPLAKAVDVSGVLIGAGDISWISGPAFVESMAQLRLAAHAIAALGGKFLRAKAWWPAARAEDFDRHFISGLAALSLVAREFSLRVVSEIISVSHLSAMLKYCDVIEVGPVLAKNIRLLSLLGASDKTVILVRDSQMPVEQFYSAIDYLRRAGRCQIILAERGDALSRSVDLSAIITLKRETRYPVLVDCSSVSKNWIYADNVAVSAIVAGADGLLADLEVVSSQSVRLQTGGALLPYQLSQLLKRTATFKQAMNAFVDQTVDPVKNKTREQEFSSIVAAANLKIA